MELITLSLAVAAGDIALPLEAPRSQLTAWSILAGTASLIAFHVGLFTLVGRERKSPYLINQVFPIFLLCLFTAAIATFSTLLPLWLEWYFLVASAAFLVFAFTWSAWTAYAISIRFLYFVDTIRLNDLPVLRQLRDRRKRRKIGMTYSHDPNPIPADLQNTVGEILRRNSAGTLDIRESLGSSSVAIATVHQGQGTVLLAELAGAFLEKGFTVQYLTASRHPVEFVSFLREHLGPDELKRYRSSIVVIDAYSSHFAFLDSIYLRKDEAVAQLEVTTIKAKATYAGMHSASSRAFKTIRDQSSRKDRDPTLVIYEDCYALADLESLEQYRVFVRHVMPSERMWGGMFTVFLESAQPDADWRILQSYASMTLDMRKLGGTIEPVEKATEGSEVGRIT